MIGPVYVITDPDAPLSLPDQARAAARGGRADIVDRLLKAGARVDRADFTGRTALTWAQEGRNARVTTLLRGAGAK